MLCSTGEIEATWRLSLQSKEFHAYLEWVSKVFGHQVQDDSDDTVCLSLSSGGPRDKQPRSVKRRGSRAASALLRDRKWPRSAVSVDICSTVPLADSSPAHSARATTDRVTCSVHSSLFIFPIKRRHLKEADDMRMKLQWSSRSVAMMLPWWACGVVLGSITLVLSDSSFIDSTSGAQWFVGLQEPLSEEMSSPMGFGEGEIRWSWLSTPDREIAI